jgi:hypothetical protein
MSNMVGFNKKSMAVVMCSIYRRVDQVKIYKSVGGSVICKNILVEWLELQHRKFYENN